MISDPLSRSSTSTTIGGQADDIIRKVIYSLFLDEDEWTLSVRTATSRINEYDHIPTKNRRGDEETPLKMKDVQCTVLPQYLYIVVAYHR